MSDPDVASIFIAAAGVAATTVVAVAALVTSRTALKMQRLTVGLQGRELAAADIARWAQNAGSAIEAMHDPESWRVPEGVEFGLETGVKAGDILPPSQGRFGPRVETLIAQLAPTQELARLSFGAAHEVSDSVAEVIESIQQIADRGVIYSVEDGQTPLEYVREVFWPRVVALYEGLEASCDFRASRPSPPS